MKKGYTLIEISLILAILAILASATIIGYKYNLLKSKQQCASTKGQIISEVIFWSYECSNGTISSSNIINDVRNISETNIDITSISNVAKTINIKFREDLRDYSMLVDFTSYRYKIFDIEQGKLIYEN